MPGAPIPPTAFVRETMLPELPPPARTTGAIGWVRENLFSSWVNGLLTVLSLLVVASLVNAVWPWAFVYGQATPGSLGECRQAVASMPPRGPFQVYDIWALPVTLAAEIFAALFDLDPGRLARAPVTAFAAMLQAMATPPETAGACWAVIRERHLQLIFGFYPSPLYWRPVLAFALALTALAPVLFTALPRRMLWPSLAAPFLVPWLLWGGSVWVPVAAVLGFALGYGAFRLGVAAGSAFLGAILAGVVPVLWWLFAASGWAGLMQGALPLGIEPVSSRSFGGFMLSITIGLVAIACSLPIGILLALGRQSKLLIIRAMAIGFIELIRGVPLITLLFVASLLLNYFLPPGTNFDIILRVIIMVTLFASAYMAEVIRGGLAALPKGQYEAADALGLDYWKAQRLVIMPQALKISIPGIVSTFIGVFKDTTLVSIIGLLDPVGFSKAIVADSSWNGIVWELYGFIAALFFVFCFAMSRYSMYLERRLRTERH